LFKRFLMKDGELSILDKIFDEAKARRIVLTLDEFAKAIGSSRASLYRYRGGESIPSDVLENAQKLVHDDSKDISHETPDCSEKTASGIDVSALLAERKLLKERIGGLEMEVRSLLQELGAMEQRLLNEQESNRLSQGQARNRAG